MGWTQQALYCATLTLAFGCTIPDLDLQGRPCPCVEGWTCDALSMTCVETTPQDASPDAPRDAEPRDTDPGDAGPSDTRPRDTSSGDSQVPDSGPSDAGPDAPAPPDPCLALSADPAVLLCESFEGARLAQTPLGGGVAGSIELDASTVHGGSQSARFDGPTGNQSIYIQFDDVMPATTEGERWVRAWFHAPEAEIAAEFFGIHTAGLAQTVNMYVGRDAADTTTSSNLHTHNFPANVDQGSSIDFPVDQWTCVEIQVDYANPETLHLFYNSEPALALSLPLADPIVSLSIGIPYRNVDAGDVVVFVDDIVVSTTRIGCE